MLSIREAQIIGRLVDKCVKDHVNNQGHPNETERNTERRERFESDVLVASNEVPTERKVLFVKTAQEYRINRAMGNEEGSADWISLEKRRDTSPSLSELDQTACAFVEEYRTDFYPKLRRSMSKAR
jgi:hypothetical protein